MSEAHQQLIKEIKFLPVEKINLILNYVHFTILACEC